MKVAALPCALAVCACGQMGDLDYHCASIEGALVCADRGDQWVDVAIVFALVDAEMSPLGYDVYRDANGRVEIDWTLQVSGAGGTGAYVLGSSTIQLLDVPAHCWQQTLAHELLHLIEDIELGASYRAMRDHTTPGFFGRGNAESRLYQQIKERGMCDE